MFGNTKSDIDTGLKGFAIDQMKTLAKHGLDELAEDVLELNEDMRNQK
jgi:hypothetical protein